MVVYADRDQSTQWYSYKNIHATRRRVDTGLGATMKANTGDH
jgi:hypothetical protein